MINTKDILSISAAATLLGLSERRVHILVRQGRLPATRIGWSWIIDKKDLDRFAKIPRPSGNPNFGKRRKDSLQKK